MRTSEAIFYCTHHAVGMVSIAFKGEDYIDEVFKKFGTRKVTVLSDMANDGYSGAACLCECDKVKATTAQLCQASWNGINIPAVGKLNGIKHQEVGRDAPCFFHDDCQVWLGKQK